MFLVSLSSTGMSYIGGIFTYILAWILLGQSSEDNLSPNDWKEFTVFNSLLGLNKGISVCTALYSIVFYCISYRIALHCIVLHCLVLYCVVSYCTGRIVLFHCYLYCIALCCVVSCCVVSCRVVSFRFGLLLFFCFFVLWCNVSVKYSVMGCSLMYKCSIG